MCDLCGYLVCHPVSQNKAAPIALSKALQLCIC